MKVEISEIIKNRITGKIRINFGNYSNECLNELLKKNSLIEDNNRLNKITYESVKELLAYILENDIAYGTKYIESDQAKLYSNFLLENFNTSDSEYYTNCCWTDFLENGELNWSSLTESTFDIGIIVKKEGLYLCVWIEDED